MPAPLVVAIEMGYGHLRAAEPLATALGVDVLHADRPPLAGGDEQRLWSQARLGYELACRVSQIPYVGAPLRSAIEALTAIPHLHPFRDLSAPTAAARVVDKLAERGLGRGLVERLRSTGEPLLTTFFTPAVIADRAGVDRIFCVVTDSDINRVWAPVEATRSRIAYLAPSVRVKQRLRAYGVPDERIHLTGFPLPHALVGGPELPALRRNLAMRLARLDRHGVFHEQYRDELDSLGAVEPPGTRGAPRITFAVGGAGAQSELAERFLPSFRAPLEAGRLRLSLVAGVRPEVAESFRTVIRSAGLDGGVEILFATDLSDYFRQFNALMADTDVLWTKPSELAFYAALGLPLLFAPPVGVHEQYNQRWVMEAGAGLVQRDPAHAAEWIEDWLNDGTLASAAWSGYRRLPKLGLYRILDAVRGPSN
jgi:UDP-N-acetylglucosamine:LPS N-acetylglucosamine transferase